MRSPYLLFVEQLASVIGGEYPTHYDSGVRRRVRVIVGGGTVATALRAATTSAAEFREMGRFTLEIEVPADPLAQIGMVATALLLLGVWWVAHLRRESIKRHVLETNTEELVTEDSVDAVQDAVYMADFVKVFFVLAVLFHAPDLAVLVHPEAVLLQRVRYAFVVVKLYYVLLFIDFAVLLGGRWARQYITNDRDTDHTGSQSETVQQ